MSAPAVLILEGLLSPQALARWDTWPDDRKLRFSELIEDAAGELQRELLQRALGAGHALAELHAFADALRPMSDAEAFRACSPREDGLAREVSERLREGADPLAAFRANGHLRDPDSQRVIPPELLIPPAVPNVLPPRNKPFDAGSAPGRAQGGRSRDLGASELEPPGRSAAPGRGDDALNAAVAGLGVAYQERVVDDGAFKLERALEEAAAALQRGVLVPVVLGNGPKQLARYALILQVRPAGASRAFELFEPLSRETVWANEGDLVGRAELPFSNKALRRISAIALPK